MSAQPQGGLKPARFDFSRAKVMVVDDSQPSIDILQQILRGFGVSTPRIFKTVNEALERLATERFDLVIVDGEMPERDGFDLSLAVRGDAEGPNFTVPIVLASGYTPLKKVARARDAGINLVILKPVVPGVLLKRIKWLASHPRQFVCSPNYTGPDRRLKNVPLPEGMEERRADRLKLMEQPERAMSQDEIDNLFN